MAIYPGKALLALNTLLILVCTLLLILDLKIKDDLVRAALKLGEDIERSRKEFALPADNIPDNLSALVPRVAKGSDNASVEVETMVEASTATKAAPKRRARNSTPRIQPSSESI
jgi:hypothetical protein